MFDLLINQYETMSFVEQLHTIAFTVFIVGGALCCFIRKDSPNLLVRPTMSSRRARRF